MNENNVNSLTQIPGHTKTPPVFTIIREVFLFRVLFLGVSSEAEGFLIDCLWA